MSGAMSGGKMLAWRRVLYLPQPWNNLTRRVLHLPPNGMPPTRRVLYMPQPWNNPTRRVLRISSN